MLLYLLFLKNNDKGNLNQSNIKQSNGNKAARYTPDTLEREREIEREESERERDLILYVYI